MTNFLLFLLSFQVQVEEVEDSRRTEEDSDDEDAAIEGIMDFVIEKLTGFEERLDSMEGAMRQMQQAATPPPPPPPMASIFGSGVASGSSTPKEKKFKPPQGVEDVKDEDLRASLQGVWMPGPRSRQELLTEAQCRYVMLWLSRDGPPTGRNDLRYYFLQLMDTSALVLC
ncbi:MAG: hypothetical protein JAY84_11110 [Candidatus Thiodiazotropha taylori]|nr:hypothetical protein [Candidatus Thiodiazotropha taylori]